MKTQAKIPSRFGFYAILTNPVKGYIDTAKILVDNEVTVVQLRIKDAPEDDVLRVAFNLKEITEGSKTRLIINDFPRVAKRCGADGVHLGQTDLASEEVKTHLGNEKIIGISTHTPEQVIAACKLNPDYIGVGPVFPTPTKKIPDAVIGIDGMKRMLSSATVPAVAIGGIDLSNLRQVLDGGAVNFCMVRQFTESENPEKVLKEINKIYKEYYPDN